MKKIINYIIYVIFPLMLGVFIYVLFRKPPNIIYYFVSIDFTSNKYKYNYNIPQWLLYNFVDFLWIFSFTSFIMLIWNGIINKKNIIYVVSPLIIGISLEMLQYFQMINGTFDPLDILMYVLGGLLSILLTKKNINYEKKIIKFI